MTRRESLVRLAGPSSPRFPRAFRIVRWVADPPPPRAADRFGLDTWNAATAKLWAREYASSILGKSLLFCPGADRVLVSRFRPLGDDGPALEFAEVALDENGKAIP